MTEGEYGVVRYLNGIQDGIVHIYTTWAEAQSVAEGLAAHAAKIGLTSFEYRVVEYSRVP